MRMRKRSNLEPRMERSSSVWIREPEKLRGNWRSLMPECRQLRVEVGCGKGKFTVETAAQEPDVLLIAIEKVPDALVLAMEAAIRMELKNVFFVSLDADCIEEFFAESEIDLLYLNFCDPWPRKKQAKRRLTHHTFLERYKTVLKLNGEIHFKTDNAALFEWSIPEFESCFYELRNVTRDLHANGPVGIMTGYEERFYELGTPINRLEAVLVTKEKRPPDETHYEILKLREHPRMVRQAADWFSHKWSVPLEAYVESMEQCTAKQGPVPQWYLVMDAEQIVGGIGVIENDFHDRPDLHPNVCAVYVEKNYRCQGIAGKMLRYVCEDMHKLGFDTLYLLTDHDSFYERYGWEFFCMAGNTDGGSSRMYVHHYPGNGEAD